MEKNPITPSDLTPAREFVIRSQTASMDSASSVEISMAMNFPPIAKILAGEHRDFHTMSPGSDQDIGDEINQRIVGHPEISHDELRAEVRFGVVTLSGTVFSQSLKDFVGQEVQRLPGVRELKNELLIKAAAKT